MTNEPELTAPTKVCPHCGVQAQTTDARCPNCGKKYRKKQRTFMKVTLGIVLGGVLLVAGCTALIAGGVNEAEKEQNAKGITRTEFDSVEQGMSQSEVEEMLGEPEDSQEFESQIPELQDQPSSSSCIYYPEKNKPLFEGSSFQLCFDEGKLTSKNVF